MTTYADIRKMIEENDVEYIDVRFTDPRGKLQHLAMCEHAMDEDAFNEGILFDGSSIAGWKAINESDMVLMPDTETAHMDVRFVDHDGAAVQLDADFYLEVDVENEAIAEFEQDTPGEFGGHLHGVAVGETDVVFKLMHGSVGSGHADFVTAAVHAHVEQ